MHEVLLYIIFNSLFLHFSNIVVITEDTVGYLIKKSCSEYSEHCSGNSSVKERCITSVSTVLSFLSRSSGKQTALHPISSYFQSFCCHTRLASLGVCSFSSEYTSSAENQIWQLCGWLGNKSPDLENKSWFLRKLKWGNSLLEVLNWKALFIKK